MIFLVHRFMNAPDPGRPLRDALKVIAGLRPGDRLLAARNLMVLLNGNKEALREAIEGFCNLFDHPQRVTFLRNLRGMIDDFDCLADENNRVRINWSLDCLDRELGERGGLPWRRRFVYGEDEEIGELKEAIYYLQAAVKDFRVPERDLVVSSQLFEFVGGLNFRDLGALIHFVSWFYDLKICRNEGFDRRQHAVDSYLNMYRGYLRSSTNRQIVVEIGEMEIVNLAEFRAFLERFRATKG